MANREKGGRVVFIGNIPYGVSEEQIMDIFGRCGQVMGFRLVYDKETGQPKGFGFLEYSDTDSAATAVRNLNEFELNGRTLRVDYSNDNRSTANANNQQNQQQDTNRAPPPAHFNMPGAPPARPDATALPPIPPGVELLPGVTAFDQISNTLKQVQTPQLLDFISQLKNMCASNPQQATALLQSQPQLGYAVFQAMILLNLVDTNIIAQLVATAGPQQPAQALPPQQQPPPMHYPPAQPPQAQYGQYPPGYPQQALETVKNMSREQIYAMEPQIRDQLIALRRQWGIST
ncbi:hypothetical protein M409DRAFT_35202 [Zasmidium cellare ATCC 36951]|uniref:RRM domain-containing protein n=1 Tax=Zasmidium cellare ATCC 36951 TaxID=1080233 RepID=A0A6A6D3M0_ZASCE|nr:uncharacterized protein M409DRAFT_35202 [Zasmidium cellare ATCC 36951]KAF2174014.1 hypothetical protein M409DRAFT_35202 [Zasmidium cellare ATCC 36951]